mmetsp:Transcript_30662/g.55124  ORF Transcript_30662/g.55124 Transcript_30662/m.55124 type:complete len:106 (+) Transcript_30662:1055-1372(+)
MHRFDAPLFLFEPLAGLGSLDLPPLPLVSGRVMQCPRATSRQLPSLQPPAAERRRGETMQLSSTRSKTMLLIFAALDSFTGTPCGPTTSIGWRARPGQWGTQASP